MRRREFGKLVGGAAVAWSHPLCAQQKAMPVVGFLFFGNAQANLNSPFLAVFRQGLGETGYVEGQNLAIE